MVFNARRKVIFIHGCFWHRNDQDAPYSHAEIEVGFLGTGVEGNRRRDAEKQDILRKIGWKYLVVWECELKDSKALAGRIKRFFIGGNKWRFDRPEPCSDE